jgi:NTP pyrophosphatase (non-canonical NTP hydrolase)
MSDNQNQKPTPFTFEMYEVLASRTMPLDRPLFAQLSNAALGLTGEAGEFGDVVKKIIHHGHPLDEEAMKKMIGELGDQLWYIAYACNVLQVPMSVVAAQNIQKLIERYPEGFNTQASIERVDTKEE